MTLAFNRVSQFMPVLIVRGYSTRWHWDKKHQRPKHLQRRIFEEITKPIYPEKLDPNTKKVKFCQVLSNEAKKAQTIEENEYEQFLLRRIAEIFNDHDMVVIFHVLSMPMHERKAQEVIFRREGFGIKIFPNTLIEPWVKASRYRNIETLISARNMYVVSQQQRVAELVKLSKKTSDFVMLGGIVDDRIYTRAGLEKVAQLAPMEDLLAETVAIINLPAQQLLSRTQHQQQKLVTNLSQYVKDGSEKLT